MRAGPITVRTRQLIQKLLLNIGAAQYKVHRLFINFQTPTPVHTEVNCKPVRPQGGAAANKTNMDDAEGEELERQRREDRQLEEEEKERQRHGEEEVRVSLSL